MANLTSLMTGGWELDNDLGASTNAELKQEEHAGLWERRHPAAVKKHVCRRLLQIPVSAGPA